MAYAFADDIPSAMIGDTPLGSVSLPVADEQGNPVGLGIITSVTASLRFGDGTTVPLAASIVSDEIVFKLPTLTVAGVATVTVTLATATGSVRLGAERFVIEDPSGWHTIQSARDEWRDAGLSDVQLYEALEVARVQCEAFIDAIPTPLDIELPPVSGTFYPLGVPAHWRAAQLLQCRNTWNASESNSGGEIGTGEFAVRVFPLDWAVKQLLRPLRSRPRVG